MPEDLDKILKDIEADNQVRLHEEEAARKMLQVDEETANRILEERKNKISGFKLALDLEEEKNEFEEAPLHTETAADEETPAAVGENSPDEDKAAAPEGIEDGEGRPAEEESSGADINEDGKQEAVEKKSKKPKTAKGCIRGIIYGVVVLIASGILAFLVIAGGLDMTGLNKSEEKVPVTLTEDDCKSTAKVAKILKKEGIIDQPFIFELYCKITKADGKFQPQDEVSLSADMGYGAVISKLESTVREEVTVTFPEGSTIKDIAGKLEESRVCTVDEFYTALDSDKYSYEFLNEIPVDDAHKGRFLKLEGYIFPDTYNFYVGSSGETVVRKFLDNFNTRVDVTLRSEMRTKGMSLNDTIILASIIQWEAGDKESMPKVSRVLHNRLEDSADYPRLECDSTRRYINLFQPPVNDQNVENPDYDTYKRNGLPVGAINNPGLDAIKAAIDPSDASDVAKCYYFATDQNTGITYYSKTLAEHEKICRKYGIGAYAD